MTENYYSICIKGVTNQEILPKAYCNLLPWKNISKITGRVGKIFHISVYQIKSHQVHKLKLK